MLILEKFRLLKVANQYLLFDLPKCVFFQKCRPVFCKGNHLVSRDNSCPDSDIDVLIEEFGLCLNITFSPAISLITFKKIMNNVSDILPMWGKPAKIDNIFYKISDGIVTYAIIIMTTKLNHSYNRLIEKIKRNLAFIIFARTNQEKIRILQNLGDYCSFFSSLYSSFGKTIPFWIQELFNSNSNEFQSILGAQFNEFNFTYERLETGDTRNYRAGLKTQITKLSICRQVELTKHEATVIENVVLYVNLTGELVFDFVATRDLETADVRVRVCLEDFPFEELRMSSASADGFDFSNTARVLFCAMTLSSCLHVYLLLMRT